MITISTLFKRTFDARHGRENRHDVVRSFDRFRDDLRDHEIEGLVFWRDGELQCKIKRSDFGFSSPPAKLAAKGNAP
mgnify:CR=1 FL=1